MEESKAAVTASETNTDHHEVTSNSSQTDMGKEDSGEGQGQLEQTKVASMIGPSKPSPWSCKKDPEAQIKDENNNIDNKADDAEKQDHGDKDAMTPPKDIFVGNLSLFSDECRLRDHFGTFGDIDDIRIMYHPDSNKSRRFGFMTFRRPESVDKVLAQENHFLDGKYLQVKHAVKKVTSGEREVAGSGRIKSSAKAADSAATNDPWRDNKIFVGGISQEASKDDIRELFSKFGHVEDINLLPDKETGRHRGFAFITFGGNSEDGFAAAAAAVKQRYHTLRGKTVEIKRAKPRAEDNSHRLYQQQQQQAAKGSLLGEHPLQGMVNNALAAAAVMTFQQQIAAMAAAQQQLHQQQQQSQLQQQLLWPLAPSATSQIVTSAPSVRYSPYQRPSSVDRSARSSAAAPVMEASPTMVNPYGQFLDPTAMFPAATVQPLAFPIWQQQQQQQFGYPPQGPPK